MLKTLDLHGIKHEDARKEVIHFIEDHWNTDHELEIITGNSSKMRDIVLIVIDEYKLNFNLGNLYDRHRVTIFMGG
jgi:hypothetical protein